jgi:hypothetical protein
MNKKLMILLLFFSFGCSEKVDLDKGFRNVLIDYQNKFPIPSLKDKERKRIYIYSANFWKNKKDTLLVITRSSSGITPNIKGFGIYEDKKLKPTFVTDENGLGNKFILKKIMNIKEEFYWKGENFPESFPPVYTYLVKNKELKFIKVDTIWKHWD